MPRIKTTSKTYTTMSYLWDRKELMACLGLTLEPGDQVRVNLQNGDRLEIVITNIEESST